MNETLQLFENVIKNNYCIGCGVCTVMPNSPFTIKSDKFGNIIADGKIDEISISEAKVLDICPFSGKSKNEDEIGSIFLNFDKYIGRYISIYAGYATDERTRSLGSSGGLGKWIGYFLLKSKKIDYYIQLVPNESGNADNALFQYSVFTEPEAIIKGATSAYYPTNLVEAITYIKKNRGRFAITGVPCFIKALRLLALKDEIVRDRLIYTIGIVCGGMKSANQSKMIAWQLGVHPSNLKRINFRGKNYGVLAATTKIYQIWSDKDDLMYQKKSGDIFGADYGMGFFRPKACDFCDDVVAETADISIGDVWLPPYRFDTKGYSLVIVRNNELFSMLKEGECNGDLFLEDLDLQSAIKSQEGGFRHRREALSYRLQKKKIAKEWFPLKRVQFGEFLIDKKRKKIYDLREKIADYSHISFLNALEHDNINIFYKDMKKLMKEYTIAYEGIWILRFMKKVKRKLKRMFKK